MFEIEGYTFFTMGGASFHDIADGILNPYAKDFEEQYWFMRRMRCQFRINHCTWRKEEMTSEEEYAQARATLDSIGWVADFIITHCDPTSVMKKLNEDYQTDQLTTFLEEVRRNAKFHYWLFKHYHDNKIIDERYVLLWEQIVQIIWTGQSREKHGRICRAFLCFEHIHQASAPERRSHEYSESH